MNSKHETMRSLYDGKRVLIADLELHEDYKKTPKSEKALLLTQWNNRTEESDTTDTEPVLQMETEKRKSSRCQIILAIRNHETTLEHHFKAMDHRIEPPALDDET